MESNKFMPEFLGETRLGFYYISPFYSLKIDDDLRTIWLDLETNKNLFTKKGEGGFSYLIKRTSLGTQNDFSIDFPKKLFSIFDFLARFNQPIPSLIEVILNPDLLLEQQQELAEQLKELTKDLTHEDRIFLTKFSKFINNLPKQKLNSLLSDKKYTLVFGSLSLEEKINNIVITQKNQDLKKQSLSQKDVDECFSGLVLSKQTFAEVFNSVGLVDILSNPPTLPKGGGAIFIDQGGTGKSMMKSSLKKLWKKIGGSCVEKNGIAEFSGDVNYARLIQSWYFGNIYDEKGYDKEGLFNAAIKNGVPSLLIIDEADRFVRTTSGKYRDTGAELIINEFKRYLTSRDKGGVQGYVITIFIANVDENELNTQLKMGGERLKPIYFGPPKTKDEWLKLINMYFKNNGFNFENRSKQKDELLANLILEHNNLMPHEKYMVSPRKFGDDFSGNYLSKYFDEDKVDTSGLNLYSMLHIGRKNKNINLDYNLFYEHIINDLLLREVKLAGLNVNQYKNKYYQLVGLNNSNEDNSNFSNEELKELNLILNDNVVRRIIESKYVFELLGISDPDNFYDQDYIKRLISGLRSKIGAQRYQFIDSNNVSHQIKTHIAQELLADLFKKLPNSKLELNEIKKSLIEIDFSKYQF